MQFLFSLDAADCRHWLLDLSRHIEGEGHQVAFDVRPGPARASRRVSLILACERYLYHVEGVSPFAPLDPVRLAAPCATPDMRFELSRAGGEGFTLFVGAQAGMACLPQALAARVPLPLSFRNSQGSCAAQGVPAISDSLSLWRALQDATRRIATLALMAADGQQARRPMLAPPPPGRSGGLARFFAEAFWHKSRSRLFPARFRQEHWRIGIRLRPPAAGQEAALGAEPLDLGGFHWLPDDGARYYADPVLFEHEGRTFLFLEEYPYESARGVISYSEVLETGELAFEPRRIIERAGHLSFPLVFAHDGEIYMAPENAAEGHVPLYRARRFPDDWEELAPLLPVALHDATLLEAAGCFWLLGNLATQDGSSCDVLVAYRASSPLGPFEAHPIRPLMQDARFTRAGGAIIEENGVQLRIVQDCCEGYGSFLRFCRIEMTPEGDMSLTDRGSWHPPADISGLHSYSRTPRFEAIDILTSRDSKPR